jgi:hypothetical protein
MIEVFRCCEGDQSPLYTMDFTFILRWALRPALSVSMITTIRTRPSYRLPRYVIATPGREGLSANRD